jgi:lipopolysaccharide heptosyltransferase III
METILVYRTGQLGDTICTIPAIQAIRENFGRCSLVLLTDVHPETTYPKAYEVLSEFGLIDAYLFYDPRHIFSPSQMIDLRRRISHLNCKQMVYLAPRQRSLVQRMRDFMFFMSCGIKKMYGLRLIRNSNLEAIGKHEVDRLMDVLRLENFRVPARPSLDLPVLEQVKTNIDKMWASLDLNHKTVVAVGSGSKMPVKRWDLDNYRLVGMNLIKRYEVQLIVLGGPEDAESADVLCKAWSPQGINLAGKTLYAESAEILRRCQLYVGNDSGAMHLAAAVGTPCVAIFSARDEVGAWYPYGKQHIVLRKEVECQGCMLTKCVEQNMKCIRNISVDEVIAACEKVLTSQRTENPLQALA